MDKDYSLLRPFDLDAAKKGEPIITRDGRTCKYIGYAQQAQDTSKVIVQVDGNTIPQHYAEDGSYIKSTETSFDLFMEPGLWWDGKPLYKDEEPRREPFSLERAKAGDPIVTRDGRMCEYIGYAPHTARFNRVIVQINGSLTVSQYCEDGAYVEGEETNVDLFMLPLCNSEEKAEDVVNHAEAMAFALKNCIAVMESDLKGLACIQHELRFAKESVSAYLASLSKAA